MQQEIEELPAAITATTEPQIQAEEAPTLKAAPATIPESTSTPAVSGIPAPAASDAPASDTFRGTREWRTRRLAIHR